MSTDDVASLLVTAEQFYTSGKVLQAIACYKQALQIEPRSVICNNLGILYTNIDKHAALEYFKQAIELNNNYFEAYNNLGSVYRTLGDLAQAEYWLKRSLAINPQFSKALLNLGLVYKECNNLTASYNMLMQAKDCTAEPDALLEIGNLFLANGNYAKAIASYQECLDNFNINNENIYYSLADAYVGAAKTLEAIKCLDKLIAMQNENIYAISKKIFHKIQMGLWDNLQEEKDNLLHLIRYKITHNREFTAEPFAIQCLDFPLDIIIQCTSRYALNYKDAVAEYNLPSKKAFSGTKDKITIGYISADFNNHPLGLLFRNNFIYHNRDQFKCYCYSLGVSDSITCRIENSADKFVDLSKLNAYQSATTIYNDNVDILVDLSGFTGGGNASILALEPAKIQCHASASTHSMAAPYIPYYITHADIVPPEIAAQYSETVVYLPTIGCATEPFVELPNLPTREELGLPEGAFVFCSFAQTFRICEDIFKAWMEILINTPHSVLWLRSMQQGIQQQFRERAREYNVNPNRLIFFTGKHLSQDWVHAVADLWLDTKLFSSGTGTYLSLWAEVPLLSLVGDSPQTRVSYHILHANGLDELVTSSVEQYIAKAIYLYNNPGEIDLIRNKIKDMKLTGPCFKPKDYMQNLEHAYLGILDHFNSKRYTPYFYV